MKRFDHVKEILTELTGIENIRPEQELQKDLGLDSLQMVTLLMMLEETFGIVLDESDMNPYDLITVESVIILVEKYIGGEASESKED